MLRTHISRECQIPTSLGGTHESSRSATTYETLQANTTLQANAPAAPPHPIQRTSEPAHVFGRPRRHGDYVTYCIAELPIAPIVVAIAAVIPIVTGPQLGAAWAPCTTTTLNTAGTAAAPARRRRRLASSTRSSFLRLIPSLYSISRPAS